MNPRSGTSSFRASSQPSPSHPFAPQALAFEVLGERQGRATRRPRFSYDYDDYAQLARVAEWQLEIPGEEG